MTKLPIKVDLPASTFPTTETRIWPVDIVSRTRCNKISEDKETIEIPGHEIYFLVIRNALTSCTAVFSVVTIIFVFAIAILS
jgi:hypothetical protein